MSEGPHRTRAGGAEPPQDGAQPGRVAFGTLLGLAMLVVVYHHGSDLVPARYAEWRVFGWFALNVVCLLIVPVLLITLVWRQRLADYGLQWGSARLWGRYLLLYAAVVLPVVIFASRSPDFQAYYPVFGPARHSFWAWALSFVGWGAYFLAWEFFFRGFLLNLIASRYGAFAIVVQTIAFTMMHFRKPEAECWSAIIAGVALGLMAYRSRSCAGTWLLHWGIATVMDLLVILWPTAR
jgi:uncharacterized protein